MALPALEGVAQEHALTRQHIGVLGPKELEQARGAFDVGEQEGDSTRRQLRHPRLLRRSHSCSGYHTTSAWVLIVCACAWASDTSRWAEAHAEVGTEREASGSGWRSRRSRRSRRNTS